MTQKERAQVWAKKGELFKVLVQKPASDKRNREHIKDQIEVCNQALIHNKLELVPQREESTTVV